MLTDFFPITHTQRSRKNLKLSCYILLIHMGRDILLGCPDSLRAFCEGFGEGVLCVASIDQYLATGQLLRSALLKCKFPHCIGAITGSFRIAVAGLELHMD